MKRVIVLPLLLLLFAPVAARAAASEPRPLEIYIQGLKKKFQQQGDQPFEHRFPGGLLRDKLTVTPTLKSYARFDEHGAKVEEWSWKKDGTITYEEWYAPKQSKERLLEDDRNVSYTSFYRNREKWEQYTFNKQKNKKAYYVYSKEGKLLNGP